MSEQDFPHASIVEGLRFTAQIVAPNVAQGLFRRRKHIAAVATKIGVDGLVVGFMSGLKRSYGEGPVWIRVAKDEVLLLLGRDGIRRVLEASPDPFAADPEPKKSGMARFQPDALTISRNPEWADRRRFTEAVLDTGQPLHRLADSFAAASALEAARLPSELGWDTWSSAVGRLTRRVVLGEGAADDEQLSELLGELMEKSNPPGTGSTELYQRYTSALLGHVRAAAPDSLVGLFADAPVTDCTAPAGQVTHWLFALADTLAINALRCLALLASFDDERARVREELADADLRAGVGIAGCRRLGASLQEAMRLWPTTGVLSRETIADIDWDGINLPGGTQILIVNTFNHRDRDAIAFADRLDPEQWLSGGAAEDWSFNHFSHGPQGCPGAGLALFLGTAMLATVLRDRDVNLEEPRLDPAKPLPPMLDFFSLRFQLSPA